MKKSINEISQIKIKEDFFSTEVFGVTVTWYAELNSDSIVTYRINAGSRKRTNKSRTIVSSAEMQKFFYEIYEFVKTADSCANLIDDCSHIVTLVYARGHKDILEGCPVRNDEQMLAKIYSFMIEHGVKDDWIL